MDDRKPYVILALVVIVLGGLLVAIGIRPRGNGAVSPQANPNTVTHSTSSNEAFTLPYYTNVLFQGAKLNFPLVASQKIISQEQLPLLLKNFILGNATSVIAQSVVFVDKNQSVGFHITYQIPNVDLQILDGAFSRISPKSNLMMINGQRTLLAGLMEFRNAQYQVKVLYTIPTTLGKPPIQISLIALKN